MKKLNTDTLKLIEAIGHFIHEVEDELYTIEASNKEIQKTAEFPIDPRIKEPTAIENYAKKIEWRIAHVILEMKKLKGESHEILFR